MIVKHPVAVRLVCFLWVAAYLQLTLADGPVRFEQRPVMDRFTYSFGVATADLDGDGDLDITAADALPNNHLYWFENIDGDFRKHFIQKNDPERLERHAIGDIDNDGHPDVVIVKNLFGDLLWFRNNGNPGAGKLWERHVIAEKKIPGAYDVALGDFDGDGDLDAAASTWRLSNNFVWFENDGSPADGEWTMRVIDQLESETRMIRTADIDQDGDLDLVGTARLEPLVVWYENSQGDQGVEWTRHVIDNHSPQPIHGQVVDMDADGDPDLVMSLGMTFSGEPGAERVVWYENDGDPAAGPWRQHLVADGFTGSFEACAGDLDGDQDVDVVATAWGDHGKLVWFENTGHARQPSWKQHTIRDHWPRANAVRIADLDGDGRLDVLAGAERGANEVCWWRNAGSRDGLEIGLQRQLFLDDFIIEEMDGLQRTMHQPEKRGAVIRPDQPGEDWLQTRCLPAWDEDRQVFKIWLFGSSREAMGKWGPVPTGASYAESEDGLNWTKPVLRQTEVAGSLDNNYISVVPGDKWPENIIENVVYDPHDPDPGQRFKGFLGAIGRRPMVSPDGRNWTLLDVPALPSRDESNLSYDPDHGLFVASLKKRGPNGRSHAIWTSRDFRNWTDTGTLFHADQEDQRRARTNIAARLADDSLYQPVKNNPDDYHADIYNIGIFHYEGIYIGMPAVFHHTGAHEGNSEGFHLIQLACSRDLRHWNRLADRQTFIGPSPATADRPDWTQLLPPSGPVVRDDELWFYYSGLKYRATPDPRDRYMGAVCLAVLRRDGFMSLDAGPQQGQLLTQPFFLRGEKVFVNVDAGETGQLVVEAVDEAGKVVATSQVIGGDDPRHEVVWAEGDIGALQDQPIRLRFTMRQTQLYSFWIAE